MSDECALFVAVSTTNSSWRNRQVKYIAIYFLDLCVLENVLQRLTPIKNSS